MLFYYKIIFVLTIFFLFNIMNSNLLPSNKTTLKQHSAIWIIKTTFPMIQTINKITFIFSHSILIIHCPLTVIFTISHLASINKNTFFILLIKLTTLKNIIYKCSNSLSSPRSLLIFYLSLSMLLSISEFSYINIILFKKNALSRIFSKLKGSFINFFTLTIFII